MSESKKAPKDQSDLIRLRAIYSERLMDAQSKGDMPAVALYAKMLSELIVGGR